MNVYSLNPQWLKDNALEKIIDILKVKKVYCFIASDDYNRLSNVELLRWNGADLEEFLKKCVYNFVNVISEPVFFNGEFTGERIVKNMYNDSLGMNPIYNIENLNDPNILILWTSDTHIHMKRGVLSTFKDYSMNILNKYGAIDYMERICFYCFDSYLSCSYIFKKAFKKNMKWVYRLSVAVIANRYEQYDSQLNHRYVDHSYDPLLSYMFMKTKNILEGNTLQERFLTIEGIKEFEDKTITNYFEYRNDMYAGYEPDNSLYDRACKAEEDYITEVSHPLTGHEIIAK